MKDTRNKYTTYDKCKKLISEQKAIQTNEKRIKKHEAFLTFAFDRLERAINNDSSIKEFKVYIAEKPEKYPKARDVDDESELPSNAVSYYLPKGYDIPDPDYVAYKYYEDLVEVFIYLGYTVIVQEFNTSDSNVDSPDYFKVYVIILDLTAA